MPRLRLKKIPLFVLTIILISVGFFSYRLARFQFPIVRTVEINNQKIKAEVVTSAAARYRGLSGRKSLCPDCGLLFDFGASGEREFVMRKMSFPLDIIFINDGRIIKIASDLPPENSSPNTVYPSDGPADQVLEVNGGYCASHGIKVGDIVSREK